MYERGVDGRLDPCRNAPRAKAMLESVIMHLLEPDEHSVAVAQHLLRGELGGHNCLRLLFLPSAAVARAPKPERAPDPGGLSVKGMHCGGCFMTAEGSGLPALQLPAVPAT